MKDLTGQRFGKLVVVKHDDSSTTRHPKWICQCDCGSTKSIHASALTGWLTNSCGCLRRETMDSKTRLHHIWKQMRHRALKHTSKSEYHFDRGITMCDEWANDFKTFKEWSLANGYDDSLSSDRIDNDKGYSPDNCRWTTAKIQANNRRNNVYITINNETLSLSLWCDKLGINRKSASAYRRQHGISYEETIKHYINKLNV
jgi:hypothetical protein